jgi:hypothetical protein
VAGSSRLVGAFALGAACLCRYEPWAAAAAFAVLALYDGALAPNPDAPRALRISGFAPRRDLLRASRRTLRLAALVAVAPAAGWIARRHLHGDALFFLHQVAAYRRALSVPGHSASLLAYPRALLQGEPELMLPSFRSSSLESTGRNTSPRSLALPSCSRASSSF